MAASIDFHYSGNYPSSLETQHSAVYFWKYHSLYVFGSGCFCCIKQNLPLCAILFGTKGQVFHCICTCCKYCSISSAVSSCITSFATVWACSFFQRESWRRMGRMEDALTEKPSSPHASKRGVSRGSAAASPHIPTRMFADFATWMVLWISLRTAGWKQE